MTKEENVKRQKQLFENPLSDTYRTFMQGKARWGYVFVTDTWFTWAADDSGSSEHSH